MRQASPRRRPWHVDYLHQRELVRGIAAARGYATGRLLDVGCGRRPYVGLLSEVSEYVGVDADTRSGDADLGALAYALPFASASFDTVLSTQTLEHVEQPQRAVAEMARVLRPGGHLILSAPQTWRVHEQPYDFFRYTRFGLRHLLTSSGLDVLSVVPQGGVWHTVGQIVNNAVHRRIRPYVPLYVMYLIYLANNMLFDALERAWPDFDEAINHVAVARKPVLGSAL
jgi:SAM-dependent methyltransferase